MVTNWLKGSFLLDTLYVSRVIRICQRHRIISYLSTYYNDIFRLCVWSKVLHVCRVHNLFIWQFSTKRSETKINFDPKQLDNDAALQIVCRHRQHRNSQTKTRALWYPLQSWQVSTLNVCSGELIFIHMSWFMFCFSVYSLSRAFALQQSRRFLFWFCLITTYIHVWAHV